MAADPSPSLSLANLDLLSWLQTRLANYETFTTTTQIREAYLSHRGPQHDYICLITYNKYTIKLPNNNTIC